MNKILLVLLFYIFCLNLNASVCYSTGNGDWANAGTWSCGHVPTCGDTIIIQAGHTVTITSQQNYAACTPTPGMSPKITINGILKFTNGNKLTLPCGSTVFINATGSMVPGSGGGNSNYLEICSDVVWGADDGTAVGPGCYPPGCNNVPLPIELIAFTGNLKEEVVFIEWKTATETNNSYFDIEKSSDGINFKKIATVNSKAPNGNSSTVLNYSSYDNDLKHPLYYYRLKQVDKNGNFKQSNLISVKIYSPELKIFPNPNNGQFWINVPTVLKNQRIDVKICDQFSIPVLNNSYMVINDNITGAKVEIVPSRPLPKGIYITSIIFDGIEYRLKMIVN